MKLEMNFIFYSAVKLYDNLRSKLFYLITEKKKTAPFKDLGTN